MPYIKKGDRLTEEAKRRISKSCMGRKFTKEHRERLSKARKGKKLTEKHKKALKGKHNSLNTEFKKGHKFSLETIRKISNSKKGKPNLANKRFGVDNPRYGKHHSEETKRKIRESEKKTKGGLTPDEQLIRRSAKYKEWRQAILLRDDFTCQKCRERGGILHGHHIKRFSKLIKEVRQNLPLLSVYEGAMAYTPLWDISNGQTLCKKCHNKTKEKKP